MGGRLKTLVLATVVGAAALVPLFGDPRSTPVTHALWARMLLRSLDMTDAVRASTQASQVFSTLAWRDSLSYPADRYMRAEGAVAREEGGQPVLAAGTGPAEVVYALAVAQPGDYQLRARLAGQPGAPATAEILPMAGGNAIKAFTLLPAVEPGWVFAGSTHLDPGAYAAQFLLPPGCTLSQVEIAPPCVNSIEPAGGWKPTAVRPQISCTSSSKTYDRPKVISSSGTWPNLCTRRRQKRSKAAPSPATTNGAMNSPGQNPTTRAIE